MNQSPESTSENPWKQFASLPKPDLKSLGIAGALFALGSLALPLSFFRPWIAAVLWVVLLFGGFWLTRRISSGARLTLATSVLAFLFSYFDPSLGAVAAALSMGLLGGAFLQTITRKFWIPVLLAAAAAGAAYAVTQDWMLALTALILLPAVLLLSVATNMGEYRTTAVCYALGGFLLAVVVLFLVWVWRTSGTVSLNAVRNLLDSWQNQVIQSQVALREDYIASIRQMIQDNPSWSADQISYAQTIINGISQTLSDEVITDSVARVFNLFPAFVCVLCAIPAFLGQKMLTAAYVSQGMSRVVTPESEFFTMSVPAAVLYIVSMLVTLLFSSSFSVPVTVVSNLCIILLPGFLVLGVRSFVTRFSALRGNIRGVLIVLILVMLCCMSYNAFLLIALYGAYERILLAVRRRLLGKLRNHDDSDDSSGPL